MRYQESLLSSKSDISNQNIVNPQIIPIHRTLLWNKVLCFGNINTDIHIPDKNNPPRITNINGLSKKINKFFIVLKNLIFIYM